MASPKVNYGKKKAVASYEPKLKENIFLLAENSYTNGHYDSDSLSVKKCFCSDCQKAFNVDLTLERNNRGYYYNSCPIALGSETNGKQIAEVVCPDCGEKATDGFMIVKRNPDDTPKEGHINMSGAWRIPPVVRGRYLFEFDDEAGKPTRVEDNIMRRFSTVFPSGKTFSYDVEYSESLDLMKNRAKVTETKILGDNRTVVMTKDSMDGFSYAGSEKSFDKFVKYGIKPGKMISDNQQMASSTYAIGNPIANAMFTTQDQDRPSFMKLECDPEKIKSAIDSAHRWDHEFTPTTDEKAAEIGYVVVDYPGMGHNDDTIDKTFKDTNLDINNKKFKIVERRFEGMIDDVYSHSAQSRLLLKEFHANSSEENTEISPEKINRYMQLMVKYPVAFQYAAERADERGLNHFYDEQRKQKADPSYTPRTLSDSAKAKMFRDEIVYVSEQLTAVDDKVLSAIGSSKDVSDMKSKLQFFTFGDTELPKLNQGQEATMPANLSSKDGNTIQDPYKATKALQAEFRKNPIGVANTVYTCHKMGIKDINHVNQMIEIAGQSEPVIPKTVRKGNKRFEQTPKIEHHRHADTIAPIRSRVAMQFMRNYMNTHNHTDAIQQVYGSAEGFNLCTECISIYETIVPYAKIADKPDEIKENQHELEKTQIREYLTHKSVKDAYVDFIEKYGDKTEATINEYALEIKKDKANDAMYHFYKTNGYDETVAKYGAQLAEYEDPKAFLDSYAPRSDKKCVVTTRNGKALFANNSLDDIHDELSHMAKNVSGENREISYSDKEKALEASYDAPDGSGTWSFSLHKDTYEMIRTATELSNCLASHQDRAVSKYETLLFMRNELGEKVACISLNDTRNGFRVDEFQAAHDNAVDGRYKDICLQWMDEHDISYKGNHNVAAIGTDASFYGGRDVDYHHEEIDDVNGRMVDKSRMAKITQRRVECAKSIYGVDENGNIKVPEVPEELQ